MRKYMLKAFRKMTVGIHGFMVLAICKAAKIFGYQDIIDDVMKSMCKIYEKQSDYYAAYKIRPKTQEKIYSIEEKNPIDETVGIVMQGPIFVRDHFTLETIRIYGKLFPGAKVILSTWGGRGR